MLSKTGVFIIRKLNHYQTLGLHKTATAKEVKSKFRELSKECHPDKYPENPSKEAKFKQLNDAYQVLSDRSKRADYDKTMVGGSSSGGRDNPIRSARDYARHKKESGGFYNEYSNINDPPYSTGDFKKRENVFGKNKYGFQQETNFGGGQNNKNKSDTDAKNDKNNDGKYNDNKNNDENKYQNFRKDHQPSQRDKTNLEKAILIVLLTSLNLIGANNLKAYELQKLKDDEKARNLGFGHRDPTHSYQNDKNSDLPRLNFKGQDEMRKMSAYNEIVRMEKLRKEAAEKNLENTKSS